MLRLEVETPVDDIYFLFYTMDECKEFMDVFDDHFCNVPWSKPVEIPDNTYLNENRRKVMSWTPKKRAEAYLSWGFQLCRRLGIGLTQEQNDYINSLMVEE